jgi:hypothetical protein
MTAGGQPSRVRLSHVEWVRQRLGGSDLKILQTVNQLRLITGLQLERLHFADLPLSHRSRTRRRVLARLVEWRLLRALERRIGGVRAGSSGLVYALDSAGQWLANMDARAAGVELAVRRQAEPSTHLVAHTLGVSELCVRLCELERLGSLRLAAFVTEPACWWPSGAGGWVKPDAYLALETATAVDHWWLEHDGATESLPTIKRKLSGYLDLVRRGVQGPNGVIPRVLITVPTEARRDAIAALVSTLPDPAAQLFHVSHCEQAASVLVEVLRE